MPASLTSALAFAALASATVSLSGQTLIVNGLSYYVAPDAVSIISATGDMLKSASTSGVDLIPLTVLEDSTSSFTSDVFRAIVSNYTSTDDVFNLGFLQGTHPSNIYS